MVRQLASGALVLALLVPVMGAQGDAAILFSDDFERGLDRWEVLGERAVAITPSGDPGHGSVLELTPNGDVAALIRGSDAWGSIRLEGEMLFPSSIDNYLGFIYHHAARGPRRDFGLIYVKGNESYLQLNPHRDFNVSRTIYPEFHVPLLGVSAVATGVWQRFALEIAGPAAHLYIGHTSTPQLTFADFERDRGAIGLQPRSVGGPVLVDHITVRRIKTLTYEGPPVPSPSYARGSFLTDWQVAGPFTQTDDRLARDPAAHGTWTPFAADARGAVVTGRIVDFHGPATVAYLRTTVTMASQGRAELQFSTADDLAVWVNGEFQAFLARQDAAWFDSHTSTEHRGRRLPVILKAGNNDVVVRARGGVYASGGFFARIASAS